LSVWDYFNLIPQFFPGNPIPLCPPSPYQVEGGRNLEEGLKPLLTPDICFKIVWRFFPIFMVEQVGRKKELLGWFLILIDQIPILFPYTLSFICHCNTLCL